ncbi:MULTISPECIES: hypothetical protein [Antarcticibacterium]|uniref:hypothetical protein n=1 Tax=Antarcticibacterium TaxID=2058174 RepID=UPI00143CE094|nr:MULTISPECIES: hypothetical protein [Antarcticibacterium]
MNKFLLLLVFTLSTSLLAAQENYNNENLMVTAGDLQTNTYSRDSTAGACTFMNTGLAGFRIMGNTICLQTMRLRSRSSIQRVINNLRLK